MADRPTLIIVNPRALRIRRSGLLDRVLAAAKPGCVEVLLTDRADHARDLCHRDAGRYAKIIAAGGDGLLNEVIDGSFGQPVAIAPLPAGSGNDYVKALPGYPATLPELLSATETMPADVGRVTFSDGTVRHFASEAGAGMDAACVRLMPQWLSRFSTVASYNVGALRAIIQYTPYGATVTVDDTPHRYERIHMLAVANTTYFGDGMRLAPDARFDDGRFHVTIVKDFSKFALLRRFKMLREGTHTTYPGIVYQPCHTLTVTPDRPLEMCIDGDYVAKTPARFENLPKAVRLIKVCRQP